MHAVPMKVGKGERGGQNKLPGPQRSGRGPDMLHMFFFFSVVFLCIE